jgi:regulator of cell morphogenesis and NO signaling
MPVADAFLLQFKRTDFMFLQDNVITADTVVRDIVQADYRTAAVFDAYGIDYCCGGRWSVSAACLMKGVQQDELLDKLRQVTRTLTLSTAHAFEEWDIDFLIDYIQRVHHTYLRTNLPPLNEALDRFAGKHRNKYAYIPELEELFMRFSAETLQHITQEEEVTFPYILQVAHAYADKDSLATLLVKTLRKPLPPVMEQEHRIFSNFILPIRELTSLYTPPENACTSHRVLLGRLRELDNDLSQHIYLETAILFPRIINMEKELLGA